MAKLKLRVHPRSSAALTKLSGHQPDGCPAQEGKTVSVQTLPVLGQAAAPVEPADRPFDDPAFGQHHELAGVGPFDDLDVDLLASPLHAVPELRPLVAAIGVELQQKREQTEQRAHQQQAAIMKRFKSPRQVQRFLSIHDQISNVFSRRPLPSGQSLNKFSCLSSITYAELSVDWK